ncbi:MAG: hypothetical protein DI582_06010 [Azospirillum brasilense]|nr:MAG: hypothetical protein DI582_06010 [Azospirillum brasilense]
MNHSIYDPQERRVIETALDDMPYLLEQLESLPAVRRLRLGVMQRCQEQGMPPQAMGALIEQAVEAKHQLGYEAPIESMLAPHMPPHAQLVQDTAHYVNLLHGLNMLVFAKMNTLLGTMQVGDVTLPQAQLALVDCLHDIDGVGQHSARAIMRDVEARIEQTMARCVPQKGR